MNIPALDGYPLGATLHEAPSHDTVLVVNGATAVPSRFYADFAASFRERGWTVVTYDYRGVGASRPERLRGFEASASDWALNDLPGVLRWVRQELSPRRLFCVGHSFGGQVIGMLEDPDQVTAMVTVSAQSGYWGLQPGAERHRVRLVVTTLMPGLSRLLGYFPGRSWAAARCGATRRFPWSVIRASGRRSSRTASTTTTGAARRRWTT
jgi:predicted alpha/beta hydrolase